MSKPIKPVSIHKGGNVTGGATTPTKLIKKGAPTPTKPKPKPTEK